MNAKETYKKNYGNVKASPSLRWTIEHGDPMEYEVQALKSYRMATAKNPMTFAQFIDCLEAAYTSKAYATRNHWFFVVDGQELQFTKEEYARFARYFSEGFLLNWSKYSKIKKAGGCYLNENLLEQDELFPLRAKAHAYKRFIIGNKKCAVPFGWVAIQNGYVDAIKNATNKRAVPDQADYETEQADLQAEMRIQRYG